MCGQDCLYKLRAAVPGILITTEMRIHEPGEAGTAAQLHRHLANSRIKVLLINSVSEPREGPEVSTRIDAFLTAPFDPAEMIRTVRLLAGTSLPLLIRGQLEDQVHGGRSSWVRSRIIRASRPQ